MRGWTVVWAMAFVSAGCSGRSSSPGSNDGGAATGSKTGDGSPTSEAALARAEDQRRAKDVSPEARTSHDVKLRRRSARALARIADSASLEGLYRALSDEDAETMAWGAFGLGAACEGGAAKGADVVRALAARFVSLGPASPGSAAPDPLTALVRAVGRCGGETAEPFLAAQLNAGGEATARAAYALGDIAAKARSLDEATAKGLLDAAASGSDAALYPFARLERVPKTVVPKLLSTARKALERPGDPRIFAVRALGRAGSEAIGDLLRVLRAPGFSSAERAEAAHALGGLGKRGHEAAAEVLEERAADDTEQGNGVVTTLMEALGSQPPKRAETTLRALAKKPLPAKATPALTRRVIAVRCAAAAASARGAYDSDVLRACDPEAGETYERARLRVLLRGPLRGNRQQAWTELAHARHLKVREAALEAIAEHPELGASARAALTDALAAEEPGVVATAADVIHAHPERAFVGRDHGRDTDKNLDSGLAHAVDAALGRVWAEDAVEARLAVIDAGIALGTERARATATEACHDPNTTVRQRAQKALATAGASCPPEHADPTPAEELERPLARPAKVVFQTDAGRLAIRFDPELSPVAATRFVALARTGFYRGIVVHRVVPWFVVQFGDKGADGYGGAGKLLRCETSPVPFGPLDVGVALAGRDTGSSQIFVTLARTPHLDGEYARVGHAEGDWGAVVEGDVIREVTVED